MAKVLDRLRPAGYALFSFPAGIPGTLDRYRVLRALNQQSCELVRYSLCDPSVEDAEAILPISENKFWAANFISTFGGGSRRGPRALLIRWVKRLAFRWFGKLYPFWALLVLVRKPQPAGARCDPNNLDELVALAAQAVGGGRPSVAILTSRLYSGKQFLFLREPDSSELCGVVCVCEPESPAAPLLQRAGRNLGRLSVLSEKLARQKIGVPKLLHSGLSGSNALLLTTPAHGRPLSEVLTKSHSTDGVAVLERLEPEILRFLVSLHDELNESLQQEVEDFGDEYLENYLRIDIDSRSLAARFSGGPPQVQHGDLTAENVFFEEARQTWDVIDWEWLGRGYPPLFDLFSLIRSIGLTQSPPATRDWRGDALTSFVRTFFSENRSSRFQRSLLERYRNHFKIDESLTFEYFKLFLLWRCNRYRLNGAAWQGALNVWQDMLKYAANHSQDFALG